MKSISLAVFFIISFLLFGCASITPTPTNTSTPTIIIPAVETSTPKTTSLTPPTIQPTLAPSSFGPDHFPQNYNPLTGQSVANPPLLELPALLVSISNFPAVARPQAGLSFAPFVYEFYITEGATRFLTAFYGEFPKPELPITGDCQVRDEPFRQTTTMIGNRVWFDENQNGVQDPGENGIAGICVNLYDVNTALLQQTTTDSNGFYGFNVDAGKYIVEFKKPAWLDFTQKNVGDENHDSDADQDTGRTDGEVIFSSLLFRDAGLIPSSNMTTTPNPSVKLPAAQVGPVRSGRLVYRFISGYYQNSCLIYAFASEEVLEQIPECEMIMHTFEGGGAMIDIDRMKELARQSVNNVEFNYKSNLYSDKPPEGGTSASDLNVFWAFLNQSKFVYDAASEAWWRYTDSSEEKTAGIFHPDIDRLNSRQLLFDNVIILFAEHTVVAPTIVDINLQLGEMGNAFLFRDGQVYRIKWSTRAGKYEQSTGLRKPIQFQNPDGTPAALKPGHTWVLVMTTQSNLEDLSSGKWTARFIAPYGAK